MVDVKLLTKCVFLNEYIMLRLHKGCIRCIRTQVQLPYSNTSRDIVYDNFVIPKLRPIVNINEIKLLPTCSMVRLTVL